jgi:hypothetical protein
MGARRDKAALSSGWKPHPPATEAYFNEVLIAV